MGKPRLELISPTKEKRTVAPRRRSNRELRPREHLTELEVAKLIEAAKRNRHGQRDATIILICFRHGLRASELCELQWSDLEFETATLHLRRTKSERGAPFTVSGLQKLVERAGIATKVPFKVHPHMLRHATGYVLANKGTDTRTLQSYLGHRSIQSTVRYTELAPGRFKNLWR